MGLIQKIKAVFNRMFGVNEVRDIFGIEVSRSSDMQTALDLYKGMRSGLPTWCMDGTIKPTRFSNVICREIANLTLFNVNVEIDGNDALKKKFDEVLNALQEKQEESCSTCGIMIKSDGQGIEFLAISSSQTPTPTVMYLQLRSSHTSKRETGTTQKQNITDLRM